MCCGGAGMNIIAMYLPQFHGVRENDEWWGEGFTEWTAVKAAEKLFGGHEQPRVPLNENYYDLLDKNTMQWQSDLMKRYQIDGMCFYHYYFKDGRKILEQPAENLLKWTDIDMPFCFSWANESWIRSWSNMTSGGHNPWFAKFDNKNVTSNGENGVLIEQAYGEQEDWDAHYKYLAQFFHDDRYIKYNGMPVFMIYKPMDIPCLAQMLARWDVLAQNDGFKGIYTLGTNVIDSQKYGLKGINLQEPQDTFTRFFTKKFDNEDNVRRSLYYQDVWGKVIAKKVSPGASLGGFVGYDDTPRRGQNGTVIRNRSPFTFYDGIKRLLLKARQVQSPFVFINAWNEWGEGMYLEPDESFGTSFLEAFYQAKKDAEYMNDTDVSVVTGQTIQTLHEENTSLRRTIDRYRDYWRVLDAWVGQMENGTSPADYLTQKDYKRVAIYGYGMLGKHLVYQLEKTNFKVSYVIEKDKTKSTAGITLYSLDEELPSVDAVIVTVLYDYDKIRSTLQNKVKADILPIDKLFE